MNKELKMIRMGFAGIAGMGANHMRALEKAQGIQVVAVCDVNGEAVAEQSRRWDCPGYDSYERMFAETEMDAVLLCMPNWEHPPAVRLAAKHGVHVLQEKPVGRDMAEGEANVRTMEEAGLLYLIATQRRFAPTFSRVPEVMPEIGDVFIVRGQYLFPRAEQDFGWRGKKELAWRGALLSMGYHTVDLLNWYFGLPEVIGGLNAAKARPWAQYETEDSAVTMFRYPSGAIGYLLSTCAASPAEERIFLHGTKGSLEVSWSELVVRDLAGQEIRRETADGGWQPALTAQLEHFVAAVRSGRPRTATAGENLNNVRFIEAAYASAERQALVRLA